MASIIKNIQTTISQNLTGAGHNAAPGDQKFSLDQVPDLTGKVAVITGGSEGIGYGCSHTLLSHNISKLFILSMSKEVVDGAIDSIREELGEEKASRTKWLQCDLGDWKRVTEVAKQIRNETDRLDILINNSARGIMTYQLTEQGVDRHMAVNHMGHVILTSHLLPLLKSTADMGDKVRIVSLGSNAHQQVDAKTTKFESLDELNQDLGPMAQYGRSKLAAILYARYHARTLTKEYPNILHTATHPGVVDTKMSNDDIHEPYPLGGYGMSAVMKPFKKTQFEGCVSTVYAATAIQESGKYICPPAAEEPGSDLAQSEDLQDALMKLTREVVTEKTRSESVEKGCPMRDY